MMVRPCVLATLRPHKSKNPSGFRRTGFECPATNTAAGPNLALAEFIKRPQAEASNRRVEKDTRVPSVRQSGGAAPGCPMHSSGRVCRLARARRKRRRAADSRRPRGLAEPRQHNILDARQRQVQPPAGQARRRHRRSRAECRASRPRRPGRGSRSRRAPGTGAGVAHGRPVWRASMSAATPHARLFDETQRLLKENEQRAAELAVINSIQQGMAAELDFQAIIDLVGDKLRDVFISGDIGIQWRDEEAQLVRYLYVYEHGVRIWPEPTPLDRRSAVTQAMLRREPLVVNNRAESDALGIGTLPGTDPSLSSVFVPVYSGDRDLGSIALENYERENAFGESEVRLLSTVAASMGVALENARLFDETQRLLKETEQRNAELAVISSIQRGISALARLRGHRRHRRRQAARGPAHAGHGDSLARSRHPDRALPVRVRARRTPHDCVGNTTRDALGDAPGQPHARAAPDGGRGRGGHARSRDRMRRCEPRGARSSAATSSWARSSWRASSASTPSATPTCGSCKRSERAWGSHSRTPASSTRRSGSCERPSSAPPNWR